MQLPATLLSAVLTILSTPRFAAADGVAVNNASLLWGPYRPNLYLGIRPRVPESLLLGLMWGKLGGPDQNLRHTCEQSDLMASYGWTAYDARLGGTQTIEDEGNTIDITTEFVKRYDGQEAGNWALRVRGTPRNVVTGGLKTRVVFYAGMEAIEGCAECQLDAAVIKKGEGDDTSTESVNIHVEHPKLGIAEMRIPTPKNMNDGGKHLETVVKSIKTSKAQELWQTKSLFLDSLHKDTHLLPNEPGPGDLHFVQFTFQDSFEFDVLYSTQTATVQMTSADLTRHLENTKQSFKSKFSTVFDPTSPFDTEEHANFSQVVFSNLQGGLGYFYGNTKVDTSHAPGHDKTTGSFWEKATQSKERPKVETQGPYELLSHVPSRSMFPRGFLWDEGFHLLLILEWDADLALEVVRSWLALMDDDGWIAREQILGPEARSKVPDEFQVQHPDMANPPTLFWIVSRFVDMLQGNAKYAGHDSLYLSAPQKGKKLVEELYPKLKKHYKWWRTSQAGNVEAHSRPRTNLNEGYRWRGRQPETIMASGLDDYPRAEPPDESELHIDALTWVGLMAETLQKVALFTENGPDIVTFKTQLRNIKHNIDALHWSEVHQMYCDTRVLGGKHEFTCPKGYVSLFPFMLGFIGPEHPHLNPVLHLLDDPEHLWTDFGIRSLSPDSSRFGTGDNYWRGAIWININYLIIERLLELAQRPGPAQQYCRDLYIKLRQNVVKTVYDNWNKNGYAWEQYDSNGRGKRTQGFTGWTALVVKIMAFPDLGVSNEEGYYDWAVKEAKEERWNAGGVLFAALLMVFIYLTRKRFVGTFRSWRRSV